MTMTTPTHLILVCCHAIYLDGTSHGANEDEWLLAPFQSGEVPTFTQHIKAGLSLLSSTPSSLLVFSGSKTRCETQKSEAQSYLDLCFDNEFWSIFEGDEERSEGKGVLLSRVVLEEQALDSFGNFAFGILKFWKETGQWPQKITVVSHEFKRARFMDLHAKAARWPQDCVEFVGIDPTYMANGGTEWDEERTASVLRGERERGYRVWADDLWGAGEVLRGKRRGRNCWDVGQCWFKNEEERVRSGVKSRVVRDGEHGMEEEFLIDDKQPWEIS